MSLQIHILLLKNILRNFQINCLPSILLMKNLRYREVMMFSRSYLYTPLNINKIATICLNIGLEQKKKLCKCP